MTTQKTEIAIPADLKARYDRCCNPDDEAYSAWECTLIERIGRAEQQLAALQWRKITPEDKPKVGDEVISKDGNILIIESEGYFTRLTLKGWSREGYTHFRPISAPQEGQ